MAMFAQYAMAATEEALEDAGWKPTKFEQREATVRIFRRAFGHLLRSDIDISLGSLSRIWNWQL